MNEVRSAESSCDVICLFYINRLCLVAITDFYTEVKSAHLLTYYPFVPALYTARFKLL
jgi:hypothetical protein